MPRTFLSQKKRQHNLEKFPNELQRTTIGSQRFQCKERRFLFTLKTAPLTWDWDDWDD